MNTTTEPYFVNAPFSIFRKDLNQYSINDLKDDHSKAFMWHQFMLDVLHNIPRSLDDKENIIAASYRVNELDRRDPVSLTQKDIDDFRTAYTSDKAIHLYIVH